MSRDAIFIDSNRLGTLLNSASGVAGKVDLLNGIFKDSPGFLLSDDMEAELAR